METTNLFNGLSADWAMTAIENLGFKPTGEFFKLNSYENRVFDLFLESNDNEPKHIIIKIYRPERWSFEALKEEQDFLGELDEAGVPVIKSLSINNCNLFSFRGLYFTLYNKGIGRLPQELSLNQLKSVGRVLAHIHNTGESKQAHQRRQISAKDYGWPSLDVLKRFVAPEVWDRYLNAGSTILEYLEDELPLTHTIRIHGDCHRGNLIHNEGGSPPFFFVDFDDFCNGPAIQDFWMLISGPISQSQLELNALVSGYEEFRDFPDQQIKLIEPLRGLRIIHYAAWIARRWNDPTFPGLFPNFKNYNFWAEEVEALEKISWQL